MKAFKARNKLRRTELFVKRRQEAIAEKQDLRRARRKEEKKKPELKEERLKNNIPRTVENTRQVDETFIREEDAAEAEEEIAQDDFADFFDGAPPKVLITTSVNASVRARSFANELETLFPNSESVKRSRLLTDSQVIDGARKRDYTDVILIHEDRQKMHGMAIVHLPSGPSAYYRLSNVRLSQEIFNHGVATVHNPELILNNFNTRVGRSLGRMFMALFPQVPQFEGRQVATFHNQRDFIFFRRHRYMFANTDKAHLQEIGPRFTIKLRQLYKGVRGDKEAEIECDVSSNNKRKFVC